jgi:hypothetical protein
MALGAIAAVAIDHRDELRFRFEVWKLRNTETSHAKEAAEALAGRGEPGRKILEAVAFVPDLAPMSSHTLAVRQAALDALWTLDRDGVWSGKKPILPYLVEARGLLRDDAMQALRRRENGPVDEALVDAAIETMLTDPDFEGSTQACLFLSYVADRRSLPALRRAALESPHEGARYYAICIGLASGDGGGTGAEKQGRMVDPENVPVIRRALGDRSEIVRVAAADTLASDYQDASGLGVLVANLGAKGAKVDGRTLAEHGLRAIGDKRVVAALVRALESAPGPDGEELRGECAKALTRLTGATRGDILMDTLPDGWWSRWLEGHGSELPPQLDPRTVLDAPPVQLDVAHTHDF